MKSLLMALLCLCFSALAHAGGERRDSNGNIISTESNAGATAISSPTFQGQQASPTIGLPGMPGVVTPTLFPSQGPVLAQHMIYERLLELTSRFGDIVISDKDDVAPYSIDRKAASVVFSPFPSFATFRGERSRASGERLFATFTSRISSERVTLLGIALVTSKEGEVLLPPADLGAVQEAIAEASNVRLKDVLIVPVPQGYGITIGVKSEGSAGGIGASLGKLTSLFIGIGPSYERGSGTTEQYVKYGRQFLVLQKDPNGIEFTIDLYPRPVEKATALPVAPLPDEVTIAREAAAKRNADLLLQIQRQKLAVVTTVPVPHVEYEDKKCIPEMITRADGTKEQRCLGSKTGTYRVPKIVTQKIDIRAETEEVPTGKK